MDSCLVWKSSQLPSVQQLLWNCSYSELKIQLGTSLALNRLGEPGFVFITSVYIYNLRFRLGLISIFKYSISHKILAWFGFAVFYYDYIYQFPVAPLIPAWISNYIHYKVLAEITYPFLTFSGATFWTVVACLVQGPISLIIFSS